MSLTQIPFEDTCADIIGKAQRGLGLSDNDLARQAGISPEALAALKAGSLSADAVRAVAVPLGLNPAALVAADSEPSSGPSLPGDLQGVDVLRVNSAFHDMTVNSHILYDGESDDCVVIDTGASHLDLQAWANARGLTIKLVLLTHAHPDHVAALPALLQANPRAVAWMHKDEDFSRPATKEARPFMLPRTFTCGSLSIEARPTPGHSLGGVTYIVTGPKARPPLAFTGDALFARSMGGVSSALYLAALEANHRHIFSLPPETILFPGHGPLTTVGSEQAGNPFFA